METRKLLVMGDFLSTEERSLNKQLVFHLKAVQDIRDKLEVITQKRNLIMTFQEKITQALLNGVTEIVESCQLEKHDRLRLKDTLTQVGLNIEVRTADSYLLDFPNDVDSVTGNTVVRLILT